MGVMESLETQPNSSSSLRRLVIVADNSLIVEAIRIGFRKNGEFNLVGHADGRRIAAHTIVAARPEVVLLDDMDASDRALGLIQEIRDEDESIAVIVLTVEMDRKWLDRLFAAGATCAISKATQPMALATLVRETLNGHLVHNFSTHRSTNGQLAADLDDFPLTQREFQILEFVAAGATNGDVARRLWVTEQTVKFHLRNIYRKLGVSNRTQASHFAHVNGLVKHAAAPTVVPPALKIAS